MRPPAQAAIKKVHDLVDGDRIVTVEVQPFFRGGVEDIDQLDAALAGLREECERLIADGKKIVVDNGMEKHLRNAIGTAAQDLRKTLENEYLEQLEGVFDVHRAGTIAASSGPHLSRSERVIRSKIVGALQYHRSSGLDHAEAVARFVRDAAFTTLNRFVALKMLEARELVQQCVSAGPDSVGYREFVGLAPGVASLPARAGYRLYLESLFDELGTEVKVLFDRRDAASLLWPRHNAFEKLLAELNRTELANVWADDETIGWFYQFFNSKEERQTDARREPGAAQQPRARRSEPVLHAPLRRPVPRRQHARPDVDRDGR